jgi:ATP-dependent Lon protease
VLADFIGGLMDIPPEEKQAILATADSKVRLDKVLSHLVSRLEVLRLSREISDQTQERLSKSQREMLLREQLKTINKELGEDDAAKSDIAELAAALDKAKLPDEVREHAAKELKRLERMPDGAGESSMLRTYLEWLAELPWSISTEDRIDIAAARDVLNEDHYGLDKVKRRILEYLAVRKLNPEGKSPILCFVGPPGVGKTSLGQSIAKATGRKFARVSLGGIHDESEIRGHRRTYIGALPGNIIQSLRRAGSNNCVMMLDEIDKLGRGIQGDPSSALLEVLDPEQNSTFRDNYLAVPFDLSKVMFIATANMLDTIPGPLRDRMEMIELHGYTEAEKAEIAKRYRSAAARGEWPGRTRPIISVRRSALGDGTGGVPEHKKACSAAAMIAEGAKTHVHIDAPDLAIFRAARSRTKSRCGPSLGVPPVPPDAGGRRRVFGGVSRTPGSGADPHRAVGATRMRERADSASRRRRARGAEHCAEPSRRATSTHAGGAIPKRRAQRGGAMSPPSPR